MTAVSRPMRSALSSRIKSSAPSIATPSTDRIRSPASSPAWAAGPPAVTSLMRIARLPAPVATVIRRKLAKFQSSNIDQVVLLNQAGKNTHEHICESLELFAKEVMPEFQGAHPQLLKWKKQVLNREIELEEIDTTAFKERFGGNMKPITPDAPKVQAAE